jgi:ethanolamine utilization microcompartment shell protein EutL
MLKTWMNKQGDFDMKKRDIKRILSIGMVTVMCAAVTACGEAGASTADTEVVVSEDTAAPAGEAPEGEAPDG